MIKKMTSLLCFGALALASCKQEEKSAAPTTQSHQQELQQLQLRAEDEIAKRQAAESDKLASVSRARTLEKAVIVTGIAAVAFLLLGGAIGSKAKKDVLNS